MIAKKRGKPKVKKPRNRIARNPLLKKGGAHPLKNKKASRPVQRRAFKKLLEEEF